MAVHPGGYYAWKGEPASARDQEGQRLLGLIKRLGWRAGAAMAIAKSPHGLRNLGEPCGRHRVYRFMSLKGLRA